GDHHPDRHVVDAVARHAIVAQQELADARRGQDAQQAEHAVPGDEDRTDLQEVGVEVDDDGPENHKKTLSPPRSRGSTPAVAGGRGREAYPRSRGSTPAVAGGRGREAYPRRRGRSPAVAGGRGREA